MKTLVYLINGFDKGGAEVQVAKLANHFSDQYRVHVVALIKPTENWLDLDLQRFSFHHLNMQRGRISLPDVFQLMLLLKRLQPDLIHSHLLHSNLLARLFKPIFRYRLINTSHNTVTGTGLLFKLFRWSRRIPDYSTHVSEVGLRLFQREGFYRPEDTVLYNGIEMDSACQPKLASKTLRLGFLGKLREEKNIELLLDVFEQLSTSGADVELLVAGDGEKRPVIEQWQATHHHGLKLTLLGLIHDIPAFFSGVDILLMTSRREGLPMALIEAGLNQTPVVATNVGGIPEIVQQGVTGLLVNSEDANGFSQALSDLIKCTEQQRQSMGQAARALVTERFNFDNIALQWATLYTSNEERTSAAG